MELERASSLLVGTERQRGREAGGHRGTGAQGGAEGQRAPRTPDSVRHTSQPRRGQGHPTPHNNNRAHHSTGEWLELGREGGARGAPRVPIVRQRSSGATIVPWKPSCPHGQNTLSPPTTRLPKDFRLEAETKRLLEKSSRPLRPPTGCWPLRNDSSCFPFRN